MYIKLKKNTVFCKRIEPYNTSLSFARKMYRNMQTMHYSLYNSNEFESQYVG